MLIDYLDSEQHYSRRAHQRMQFRYRHKIAPLRGGIMPGEADFFEVLCNDLTPNGFSFFSPSNPNFVRLVIILKQPGGTINLKAEIRNRRKVIFFEDSGEFESLDKISRYRGITSQKNLPARDPQEGKEMYLLGCRFIGRVD